jgi:Fic family protein
VGSNYTSQPHEIPVLMKELFESYKNVNILTINEISKMHCQFEKIHPFLDGNGRIGRFIMLKQCLNNNVDLFYISNDTREEYINAIRMFISTGNSGFLTAYLKTCQKIFRITNAMYFDNDLNDNEIKILNYLNIHKEITVKIVEKILNLSLTPSNSLINKLIKKQYIKKFNQGKNTVYRVNK